MLVKFLGRMLRAAKLDASVYAELEKDPKLFFEAMIVVALSSIAAGIGNVGTGTRGVMIGVVVSLIGWFAWAYLMFLIGTKIFPEPQTKSDVGQLLRTIGFAASPGVLRVLGIIPGSAKIVFTIAGIWMLIAMVIAVRQALNYSSIVRSACVCLIGWIVQAIVIAVLTVIAIAPAATMGVVGS